VTSVREAAVIQTLVLRCAVRDLGETLTSERDPQIAAGIFLPPAAALQSRSPLVLCCLPGGALNRGYYDLLADGDATFSFARQMASRGLIVVTLDPIGTGDSSRPADGYEITPDVIAATNAQAVEQILDRLRSGAIAASLPALPQLIPIGVGHSLGAISSIIQQARFATYQGLVLLGYGGGGLRAELSSQELALAHDAAAIRANIVRLSRAKYSEPYPQLAGSRRTQEVYGGGGDKRAMGALRATRTVLLATSGLFSMIPGSTAAEAAAIDVPVFLGVGDRDLCGPPHKIPASFSGSRDVTLVVLPDTGHTHFVFPSCAHLLARIESWAGAVFAGSRSR
jgi:pimeloyl-ACP methyl ester carboxylesterase